MDEATSYRDERIDRTHGPEASLGAAREVRDMTPLESVQHELDTAMGELEQALDMLRRKVEPIRADRGEAMLSVPSDNPSPVRSPAVAFLEAQGERVRSMTKRLHELAHELDT